MPRPSSADDSARPNRWCSLKTACKTAGAIAAVISATAVCDGGVAGLLLGLVARLESGGLVGGLVPGLVECVVTRRRGCRFISSFGPINLLVPALAGFAMGL